MQELSLEKLIAQVALGDRAAFAHLYQASSAKLFGVCLRILKDRAKAEEALQEVFIKIWANARQFRVDSASPISWLVSIARNHSIDILRRNGPVLTDYEEALNVPDENPTPEEAMLISSDVANLGKCMDELPADRALAVHGAYMEGYSYQELATRFEVPLNTMRTWLRRSLLQLRACLER